jgi:hypothetical protein
MKLDHLNRWPPVLGICLVSAILLPCVACAAPISLSGTTNTTPPNKSRVKFSIGDSFTAVMDLDVGNAVGQPDWPLGFSGHSARYKGINGSIKATIGGMSWSFTPDALDIRDDFVDDSGKVRQPLDVWHLQAAGPHGLLLVIGLWQPGGSAIDNTDLFVPETPYAFGSATWALFAPSFDPDTGQQLPRLDCVAYGPIERWIAASPNPPR